MDAQTYKNIEKIKNGVAAGKLDPNLAMTWLHQEIAAGKRREAGEAEPPKLTINYFMAKLSETQLRLLCRWCEQIGTRAPHLCDLILALVRAEAERRDTETTAGRVPIEPSRADVSPMADWTNQQVASALVASSMPAAIEDDYEVGRFLDKLQLCLSVLAAARLTLSGGN